MTHLHDSTYADRDGETQRMKSLNLVEGLRGYSYDQSLAFFQA